MSFRHNRNEMGEEVFFFTHFVNLNFERFYYKRSPEVLLNVLRGFLMSVVIARHVGREAFSGASFSSPRCALFRV